MSEMRPPSSYQTLLKQFEMAKKELGEAEETIKRLTGRDPDFFNTPIGKTKRFERGLDNISDSPNVYGKRPFNRISRQFDDSATFEESPDEEEPANKRPALQSTVVQTAKDAKSRQELIKEQNVNSKVKARNRRMFGMILGTLQKFQHEAKEKKEKELKRREIEQKVEAAAEEERERIKLEKRELFMTRKEKKKQLRLLERQMEIVELHETWEKSHKPLVNFIQTEASPQIYYKPMVLNAKTKFCLEQSRDKIEELLKERRDKMAKEIAEAEEWFKRDTFPFDKENIGPENAVDTNQEEMQNPEGGTPAVKKELHEDTGDKTAEDAAGATAELDAATAEDSTANAKDDAATADDHTATAEDNAATAVDDAATAEDGNSVPVENSQDSAMMEVGNQDEKISETEKAEQDFEPIYD